MCGSGEYLFPLHSGTDSNLTLVLLIAVITDSYGVSPGNPPISGLIL